MAREVSLFLKYPGPPHVLQRLQHSFLECVVEYKVGTETELQTLTPAQLHSEYQLKGTATLVDDEIVVQFLPRHAGVHTVRIFADTRELCRPIAFKVTRSCEVESIPLDRPAEKPAPSPPPQPQHQPPVPVTVEHHQHTGLAHASPAQQSAAAAPTHGVLHGVGGAEERVFAPPFQQEHLRAFMSDPALGGHQYPNFQRASYISHADSGERGSRPVSMANDDATYAGDLFSSKSDQSSFSEMYASKKAGQRVYGARQGPMGFDHTTAVTQDTFRLLQRDIDMQFASQYRGAKMKKRCSICSRKVKGSKSVRLGEDDYCDSCFRRQFLLRSAIEHFMVPTVQECTVEVPVNKKATKFVTSRKTIPNVNLRGLELSDVRNARAEFFKFDMDGNGWINKAVLLPMMKACFTPSMTDHEVKALLQSQSLKSVIESFGLHQRDEVHEIEFLALLAFVARERQRLRTTNNPNTKFTRSDLEMAYAFRQQFGTQRGPAGNPVYGRPGILQGKEHRQQLPVSQAMPKSPTDSAIEALTNPNPPVGLRGSSPQHPNQLLSSLMQGGQLRTPYRQSSRPPSQELSQRYSMLSTDGGLASNRNSADLGVGDRPEEDQDENELPSLPPGKSDPSAPRLTNQLANKGAPSPKKMMEELRLTGGSADGWMLY